MTSLLKSLYRTAAFDTLFALIGLVSVYGIYYSVADPAPAVQAPAAPLEKALALIATVLMTTAIAGLINHFEQRLTDDFTFQTLAKSAMIAVFAFMFAFMAWGVVFQREFGEIPQRTSLAMLIAAWSLAYFYTRLRGTRA